MILTLFVAELLQQHDHAYHGEDKYDRMHGILLDVHTLSSRPRMITSLPARATSGASARGRLFVDASVTAGFVISPAPDEEGSSPILAGRGTASKGYQDCSNGDQASHVGKDTT